MAAVPDHRFTFISQQWMRSRCVEGPTLMGSLVKESTENAPAKLTMDIAYPGYVVSTGGIFSAVCYTIKRGGEGGRWCTSRHHDGDVKGTLLLWNPLNIAWMWYLRGLRGPSIGPWKAHEEKSSSRAWNRTLSVTHFICSDNFNLVFYRSDE